VTLLGRIIGKAGYTSFGTASGPECLSLLSRIEPRLVLLDVQMPDMDGYDTAAHIKSRPRTQDIPIIFLTAIDREAHQAYRGYAAGAVDFLAKPFDPWVLRAKVEVFLGLQQERRRLTEQALDLRRRLDAVSGQTLDASLGNVERLLVMAGDERGTEGPLAQALETLRAVRADLAAPSATPPAQR
jgi:CheY-like chemotaxis protein